MITDAFFTILYGIAVGLASPLLLVSDVQTIPEWVSAIGTAGTYVRSAYSVLPLFITALFSVFGTLIVIEFAIITYKVIMWLIKKIPMIS